MENWKDLAIGALIAQVIGGGWLYLRSIGDKVSKKDHEKAVAELKAEHEKAIVALKAEFDKTNAEIKGDFRRLETKIDAKLDTIQQQLLALLARDHK
jgi:hypothetical protein